MTTGTCDLANKKCVPCEGGVAPLNDSEISNLLKQVPKWEHISEKKLIRRSVRCKNFVDAIALFEKICDVAEADDHHPDLHLTGYKNVAIELTTHAIKGLSENDFIMAAKLDQLLPA